MKRDAQQGDLELNDSSLFDLTGKVMPAIPGSLKDFKGTFHLTVLNIEKLWFVPEQIRFLTAFFSSSENMALQSPTSSGKTYVALMAASRPLSQDKKVLFLTPQTHLVQQIAGEAREVLNLQPESIREIDGSLPVQKRAAQYSDPAARLYSATPEVIRNDLLSGLINLGDFDLVILDEAHYARGDYAYCQIADHLKKSGVRTLALSATLAKEMQELKTLMARLSINECIHLDLPRIDKEKQPEFFDLPASITSPAVILENGFSRVARVFKRMLSERRELTQKFDKVAWLLTAEPTVPSFGEMEELNTCIEPLRDIEFEYYKMLKTLFAELNEYRHLHTTLTTLGPFSFLNYAGRHFAEARLPGDSKQPIANFRRRMYGAERGNSEASMAYEMVAKTTPYEGLLRHSRWVGLFREFYPGHVEEVLKSGSPANAQKLFFQLAFKEEARLRTMQHPKERFIFNRLRDLKEWESALPRIMIFVDEADFAIYLAESINAAFARDGWQAQPFTGKKHMGLKERRISLQSFKAGKTNILVATRAAEEGLNIKQASLLFNYSPTTEPIRIEQRDGRVGRDPDQTTRATIFDLVARGTQDELRYWAGRGSHQRMLRESALLRQKQTFAKSTSAS